MPMMKTLLDPETAHHLTIKAAKFKLYPKQKSRDSDVLHIRVFGQDFENPVGLAAGFDKDGEAIEALSDLGFGFVEIGSITPKPQPGNPKPRLFRLVEDEGVINRYGFNSKGSDVVEKRLKEFRKSGKRVIVGVNLGKNKTSPVDGLEDYVGGVQKLGKYADYIVVNVSSPNTPNLRSLQQRQSLKKLLSAVIDAKHQITNFENCNQQQPPLLIKISPDLSSEELQDIAHVAKDLKVDGIIISNTTTTREGLKSKYRNEIGGLSGKPLKSKSTKILKEMYTLTGGSIPLIGVGGVFSGKDAYEKIRAGASLIQILSALTVNGPGVVMNIKQELEELLIRDGFKNVKEAIGKDCE